MVGIQGVGGVPEPNPERVIARGSRRLELIDIPARGIRAYTRQGTLTRLAGLRERGRAVVG